MAPATDLAGATESNAVRFREVNADRSRPNASKRHLNRRLFLRAGAAGAVAGAIGVPAAMLGLFKRRLSSSEDNVDAAGPLADGNPHPTAEPRPDSYGPVRPARDLRDGVERVALPEGFSYRSFGVAGTPMSDGNLTPLAHDGMAAFALPNGNIRLIRSHEDHNPPGRGSVGGDASKKYDPLGTAGTTSLEVNPTTRELVRDFVSLNGTFASCAGGPTPWGSFLTTEETYEGPPDWRKPHGYVFEVPASATGPVEAVPLTAMGRFVHEAAAVDPKTLLVYQTEDNGEASGFYRFIPTTPGRLAAGGKLQMLAVRGSPRYDTRKGQKAGQALPVEWIDIRDPDPVGGNPLSVWGSGFTAGGARFLRLEGCCFAFGSVFFHSTNGGDAGMGQVWQYDPDTGSGERLTLLFESPEFNVMKEPDNITGSPRGGALVICEDGAMPLRMHGLTRKGELFRFAENLLNDSEWAGAAFSPDGQTLFANWQGPTSGANPPEKDPGVTFAIWGPWDKGVL